MALREILFPHLHRQLATRPSWYSARSFSLSTRRNASSEPITVAQDELDDLEPSSSLMAPGPNEAITSTFNPLKQSRRRRRQLPPSRYQFRPPRYYRGPLHPHQPPPTSNPSSREYIPGPFTYPRLLQTYDSTIAPDFMTLTYTHVPPGQRSPPRPPRLRLWDDSSPYHKNRPPRGPRGGDVLRLLRRPTTFRNIPRLARVTVHMFVNKAKDGSAPLHAAGMVLQAITSVRATACVAKKTIATWGLREGKYMAVKADLFAEDMCYFLSRLVDVVLPRIKDWPGVKGSAGDSSGNITFGLEPEAVKFFPEVEVNYDMYPPEMIPGMHVTIHTTATNDRDARLLLGAIGIPFYGKLVD
ncbi:MAG: hypothetical protein M1816_003248 [Peltula sp. TS41687]|nr:MAG: hypothetical protein M1816_003248 [Peltula sp. TS41687]